jgi:hypothetical protein
MTRANNTTASEAKLKRVIVFSEKVFEFVIVLSTSQTYPENRVMSFIQTGDRQG